MKCTVIPAGGKPVKQVKNLGWLLDRLSEQAVSRIDVDLIDHTHLTGPVYDAILQVTFVDGWSFISTWQDRTILARWLRTRRTLYGLTYTWGHAGETVYL